MVFYMYLFLISSLFTPQQNPERITTVNNCAIIVAMISICVCTLTVSVFWL